MKPICQPVDETNKLSNQIVKQLLFFLSFTVKFSYGQLVTWQKCLCKDIYSETT